MLAEGDTSTNEVTGGMQMADATHDYKCPLHAVDRRLDDLHRQWHQAEQSYFDPEAFRVAIQTAIQTARTVSFILQSNKALIPDFDDWYGGWQQRFKAIPLMRWMVDARNRIEKQGDLESHSWIRAEILASHLDEGPREDVPANLFEGPKSILNKIPRSSLADHILKDGILRIERRWVENSLPEYELLDAVAVAYGHLALLVADAHRHMGLPEPKVATEGGEVSYDRAMAGGRMPCMIGHNENRLVDIWIATGKVLEFEARSVPYDPEQAEESARRYGIELREDRFQDRDPRSHARYFFQMARRMFLHDGHHVFMVFIFRNGHPIHMREVRIEEHGQKYVFMRSLANDVLRLGGDAVLTISEIWRAEVEPHAAYFRVADMPNRTEALSATLVMKEGDPLHLFAPIDRTGDSVGLGDTVETEGGVPYAFASLYALWGRDIPGLPHSSVLKGRKLRLLSSTVMTPSKDR